MLSNRYVVSIVVPMLLLSAGSLAKKLTRGPGWRREDFYLGVEFTLAALSSSLLYVVELGSNYPTAPSADFTKCVSAGVFSSLTFVLLLVVLSFHQDWEPAERRGRSQFLVLVVFCNFIGLALVAAFTLMIKGV
jgi:NADH:ubiquinone oxidoreductase subunit 2 (subunit N)